MCITRLAQLCRPFCPVLENTQNWIRQALLKHIEHIKNQVAQATGNTRFYLNFERRIKCDVSCCCLGAALKQRSPTGRQTVVFASRFLKENKKKYSIIELETLGGVWPKDF